MSGLLVFAHDPEKSVNFSGSCAKVPKSTARPGRRPGMPGDLTFRVAPPIRGSETKHWPHTTLARASNPMSRPPARFERIAFVASRAPEAEKARAALVRRYGDADPQTADVIVPLGGDGFMLQTLHGFMNAGK